MALFIRFITLRISTELRYIWPPTSLVPRLFVGETDGLGTRLATHRSQSTIKMGGAATFAHVQYVCKQVLVLTTGHLTGTGAD